MNKLMGFYELRELSIPTIPWKEYFPGVELSDEFLWTIRSAVNHGDDLNLPRLVGKTAGEATYCRILMTALTASKHHLK